MKRIFNPTTSSGSGRLRAAAAATLVTVLATTGLGAISAAADGKRANTGGLVGSWMVSVNRGPTLPPLQSLQTYTKGHSVIEIANVGATVRSPAHGSWERIAGRQYGTTTVFFRYEPTTGAYAGTVKLRATLELSQDNQTFTAVSVAELRDPNGQLLPGSNTRKDSATAVRINVEPVPDVP